MSAYEAYIPIDRRRSLAGAEALPDRTSGCALFADISGFTHLTEALVLRQGPLRGAEGLTRWLDAIFTALIAEVHRFGGSVIGFSGDAITCWFDGDTGARAGAAALAMQSAMAGFERLHLGPGEEVALAVKIAIACGPVRRFAVGDPDIRRVDVVAGRTLDLLAAAEGLADRGEVLVADAGEDLDKRFEIAEVRYAEATGLRVARITALRGESVEAVLDAGPEPSEAVARSWLLTQVYERIRSGQEAFLAGFRPAAALFLAFGGPDYDLRDDAGEELDAFVRWIQRTAGALGGNLIQLTTGDKGSYCYLAFGAPVTHSDDPERALAAALQLRDPPAAFRDLGPFRIGLTYGQMYTGAYGSPKRRTYGVLGDKTNLAARLMVRARPGQILCDQDLVRHATGWRFERLEAVRVKGKQEAVAIYTPSGTSPEPGGVIDPEASELVGRADDLRALEETLELLLAGRSGFTEVRGEPGIGKTRLIEELGRRARDRGATMLQSGGHSIERQTPYHAWRAVLLTGFDLSGEPDRGRWRRRVVDRLADEDDEVLARLPLLNDILPLGFEETPFTASLDATLRQENLARLLHRMLERIAGRRSLLLVLDNSHWFDSLSWELVSRLARLLRDVELPVWLIVLTRPQDDSDAETSSEARRRALSDHQVYHLGPLRQEHVKALLATWLNVPAEALPEALLPLAWERSAGNPLFVEELLRTLQDQQLLRVERQPGGTRCQLDGTRASQALPTTMQGMILARIDRLAIDRQLVLKVASVLGSLFTSSSLAATLERIGSAAAATLEQQLDEFVQLGLLEVEQAEPEPRYLFRHVLTQEVAYRTLLFVQRRTVHRAVADWYETTYAANLDAIISSLAFHYGRAAKDSDDEALIRKAVDYLGRTSDRDIRLGAYPEARSSLLEALELLPDGTTEDSWTPPRLEVLARLGDVHEKEGSYPEAIACFEEILDRGRRRGDLSWVVQGLNGLCLIGSRQGDYELALRTGEEAAAVARQLGDEGAVAASRARLGIVTYYRGEVEAAADHFRACLELYRRLGDDEGTSSALNSLGMVALVSRDYPAATTAFEEALALAGSLGDPNAIGKYLANLGLVAEEQQDFHLASERYRESLALFREIGARQDAVINLFNLGLVEFALGHDGEAERYYLDALAEAFELGALPVTLSGIMGIAGIEARRGNAARAAELLGFALAHPASDTEVEQSADPLRQQLEAALPSEQLERALARGRGLELAQVVAALGRS